MQNLARRNMKNNLFLKCECSTHCLEVEYLPEDKEYYFAFWNLGVYGKKMSWKERFRWCWQILKSGSPWADMVILNGKQLQKINNFYYRTTKNKCITK